MAYTPINWQTGDTITADKLNKMDNGWAVESNTTVYIDNASVTTSDTGEGACAGPTPYASAITDDSIIVEFDGTTYTCPKGQFGYGAVENGPMADFTNYPFGLVPLGPVLLLTATAGTYTLTVSTSTQSVEVSEDFGKAVESCVDTSTVPMLLVNNVTTVAEMVAAGQRLMYFFPYSDGTTVRFVTGVNNGSILFIPEDSGITASIADGTFRITHY